GAGPGRYFLRLDGQVAGGLVGEQGGDLAGDLAEQHRVGADVAQLAELVLDEGMADFDGLHARRLAHKRHSDKRRAAIGRPVGSTNAMRGYAAAACCTRGPSSSARFTIATTSCISSPVTAKCGVKRSEFSPPWITPIPCSRIHSSVEPAP